MAYVAGSAQVDIVPSFARAQLAITAFFARQGEEIRVPVRPDIDDRGLRQAGDRIGSKLGSAISDGMRRASAGGTSGIDKQIAKLEDTIIKVRTRSGQLARDVELAETKLNYARRQGTADASKLMALENAALNAREKHQESLRALAQGEDALREARRQAVLRQAEIEEKALLDQDRLAADIDNARRKRFQEQHAEALRMNAEIDREERRRAADAKRTAKELADQKKADHIEALRLNDELNAAYDETARRRAEIERGAEDHARRVAEINRLGQIEVNRRFDDARRSEAELLRLRQEAHAEALRMNRDMAMSERQLLQARERAHGEALRMEQQRLRAIERAHTEALRIEAERNRVSTSGGTRARVDVGDPDGAARAGRRDGSRYVGNFAQSLSREFAQRRAFIRSVFVGVVTAAGPAMVAASSGLFIGLGAAAVAQTQQVRRAFQALGQDIRSGATQDAGVLIATYVQMADRIGEAFQRNRPLLRDAFADTAPQVTQLSQAVVDLANRGMVSLARAASAAGPVIGGLSDFIERAADGFTRFLDIVSTSSATAGGGALFSNLGSTIEQLFVLMGNLSNVYVQVANNALPVVIAALSALNGVLTVAGPLLAQYWTIMLGYKVAANVYNALHRAALGIQAMSTAATTGAAALTGTGAALTGVAIAAVALGLAYSDSARQTREWVAALNEGGAAARTARAEMEEHQATIEPLTTGITGFAVGTTLAGQALHAYADDVDDANAAHEEYLAGLTPLAAAQRDMRIAEEELNRVLSNSGSSTAEVNRARAEYARASAEVARQEEATERSIRGVTEAMAEQADQARSRVDAQFSYQDSLLSVEEQLGKVQTAQDEYNKAVGEHGANSEQAQTALLSLRQEQVKYNESLLATATAAAEVAAANLPAAFDDNQRAILGAKGALDELNRLIESGIVLPPELEAYRQQLIRITGEANGAALEQAQLAAAMTELGIAFESIPGQRSIRIDADQPGIEGLTQRLEDLGFSVREVDGEIVVTANTAEALENLGNLSALLAEWANQPPAEAPVGVDGAGVQAELDAIARRAAEFMHDNPATIPIEADPSDFYAELEGVEGELREFQNLDTRPVEIEIESDDAIGQIDEVEEALTGIPLGRSIEVDALTDDAITQLRNLGYTVDRMPDGSFRITAETEQAQDRVRELIEDAELFNNFAPEMTVDANTDPALAKIDDAMFRVFILANQTPTPTADLNGQPLGAKVATAMALVANLATQRPTPTADSNTAPLLGKVAGAMATVANLARQRPTPVASMNNAPFAATVGVVHAALDTIARRRVAPVVSIIDQASGPLAVIAGRLASLQNRTITVTTVQQTIGLPALPRAGGGAIDEALYAYAGGGAVRGPGGPTDDLIWARGPSGKWDTRLSNGEHVFDAHDVDLMGGQAGVYRFRAMLNAGLIQSFAEGGRVAVDDGVRRMVASGIGGERVPATTSVAGVTVGRDLVVQDNADALFRRADASRRRAMVEAGLI